MKENLYLTNDLAIINYNTVYARTAQELLRSADFSNFIRHFLDYAKITHEDIYRYILQDRRPREATFEITKLLRQMIVLELDEIVSVYLEDKKMLLEFIEELYNFWRNHQRFSIVNAGRGMAIQESSFMEADSAFHNLIRMLYRSMEEKVQGRKNRIYRQVQSGTNAAIAIRENPFKLSETYAALQDIRFIDSIMLRTPMILHLKSNKRVGMFEERDTNPIHEFTGDKDTWFCYPAKIGSLLAYIYFHRDFISSAVSLGNLFELANEDECRQKPDLICLFGNEDGKEQTTFYYDKEENIWVGCVSYHERIQYFGYLKKMSLTLHNLAQMQKGWLPIHGAFIRITLKNGVSKGIMLMGDSGAGKSESIEALKALGNDKIKHIDVIFDDMGTIHIEDGIPYGQGTEIGAFIRLDDLDPGTPYRDMDRSIFMNPESLNARVITPAASYDTISNNHKIDLFCYANNYDDKLGMHRFADMEEAKAVCIQGKRMALGTTQEVGISTTYFANPFGPMQKQDICGPLIDEVFDCLKENKVYVGEIYTHLGFSKTNREGLQIAAKELLEFIEKD